MNIAIDGRVIDPHFPGIGRHTSNLIRALSLEFPKDRITAIRPRLPVSLRGGPWDVFHATFYIRPYYSRTPTVFTVYDLIPLKFPEFFSPLKRLIFRLTMYLSLQTARRTISISQKTAKDLKTFFGVDSTVIYPGVDPMFTPQPSAQIAVVRQKYNLPPRYALYFGSNKPHKNLKTLLAAWSLLEKPDIHLVLAGHWDRRYTLTFDKSVLFFGRIPDEDLPALYSGAELFIFPSLYEGFGFPVLEAAACGTPVVCSETSSLSEIAKPFAKFAGATNPQELASTIDEVLANTALRKSLLERGLEAVRPYSWSVAARKTRALYEEVIDRR